MSSFLLAPLHLELLHVATPTRAVEPAFDPSLLPRATPLRDLNADTAFLGDEISSPPFQNRNQVLPPGVHLHWQMPRELTRGQRDPTGVSKDGLHPRLPNRWLITRSIPGQRMRWVVESDFLHPTGHAPSSDATAYPIPGPGRKMNGDPIFRHLGRTLPLEVWLEEGNKGEYLGGLTVTGYGNPAFAAFAPNCRGVFTFHDREVRNVNFADYSVVGFYSDSADEPSLAAIPALANPHPAAVAEQGGGGEPPASAERPTTPRARMLCIGKTAFRQPNRSPAPGSPPPFHNDKSARTRRLARRRGKPEAIAAEHRIAIGNTATEALCAFLADSLQTGRDERIDIEGQLEAILMSADLDHRLQDHHAKFLEHRHARGFTAFHGGTRWLIKPESRAGTPVHGAADSQATGVPGGPPIPAGCIAPLHRLNSFQRSLEKLQATRRTLLDRLSSDWHKYMLCAYPPPASRDSFPEADRVAHLINSTTVKAIERVDAEIIEITRQRDAAVVEIQGLLSGGHGTKPDSPALRLKEMPGPRFWAPRDPVIVLAAPPELARHLPGATERVSPRPSADWPEIELPRIPGLSCWDILEDHVVNRFSAVTRSRHDDPARPIFVEWSARLFPSKRGLPNEGEDFDSNYLSSRYAPAAGRPELTPRSAGNMTVSESAYRGRSLVSAHAAQVIHERIVAFLNGKLGDDRLPAEIDDDELVRQRLHEAGVLDEPLVQTALGAWQILRKKKILCLPLGGMNDALLMRRPTAQLPIAEPIGFPEYRAFSGNLRELVGDLPASAPVPDAAFNPIRNGRLQLDRLRLIDSFGRTYDIAVAGDGVIAAEPLRSAAGLSFPPRFVQPMRVDFRWLSAGHHEMDSNSHPDTTPVCGWMLPNRLEESMAVYDASGIGIGSIDVSGLWRPVPGDDHPVVPRDIGNPHLRRVVLHILAQARDGEYQKAFLQTINAALDAIDPDSFAAHPAISLLIGRPIAVARASVRFELLGEPAEDHSWKLLDAQVAGKTVHRSRRFEDVEIPFRIGEHHMLNDGVVGYWVEDDSDGFEKNLFHAPQTDEPRHKGIASHHEESLGADTPEVQELVLKRAPSAPPLVLTLLMDPRGAAHVTSGVLPVKEIRLAENHFAEALKNISVTFLAAPLLMLQDRTEVTLPGEPGYAWSFLDRTPQGWRNTPAADILPPELDATFRTGLTLREGWLRLEPKEDAPADARPSPEPSPPVSP